MESTQNVSSKKVSQSFVLPGSGPQDQMAEGGKKQTLGAQDLSNATAKGSHFVTIFSKFDVASKTFEIPTLDDLTSYLFANEVIEKENFSQAAPQPEKNFKIPEIVTAENESEENQTLSTRTRYAIQISNFDSNFPERRVTRALLKKPARKLKSCIK